MFLIFYTHWSGEVFEGWSGNWPELPTFKEFFQICSKKTWNIETVWYPLSIFTDAICDVLGEFRFILFAFDLVVKSLGFVILKENNVFV